MFKLSLLLAVPIAIHTLSLPIKLPVTLPPIITLPPVKIPALQVQFAPQSNIDVSGILGASGSLSISAPVISLDGKSVAVSFSIPNVAASSGCMSVLSDVIEKFGAVAGFAGQTSFSIGSAVNSLIGNSISLPCKLPNVPSTTQFLNIVADAMAKINAFAATEASLTVGTPSASVDGTTVSLPCSLPNVQQAENILKEIFAKINACGAIGGHANFAVNGLTLSLPNTQVNTEFLNEVAALLADIKACGTCGGHVSVPNIQLPSLPTINLPQVQLPSLKVNFNGNANIDASALLGASAQLSISEASLSVDGQSVSVKFTLPNLGSSDECMNIFSGVLATLSAAASFDHQVSIGLPAVSVDGHSISFPCSLPNIDASAEFLNIASDVFAEINALASFEGSIFVGGVSVNGASISLPCTFPSGFLSVFQEIVASINGCLSLAGHAGASIGASVANGASLTVPISLPNIPANADIMGTIAASLQAISAMGCGCLPSVALPNVEVPPVNIPFPHVQLPTVEVPSVELPSLPQVNIGVDASGSVNIPVPHVQLPSFTLPCISASVDLPNIIANLIADFKAFVQFVIDLAGSVSVSVGDVSVSGTSVSLPCTLPNVEGLIQTAKSIIGKVFACAGNQFDFSIDSSVSVDASTVTLTITIPNVSAQAQHLLNIVAKVLEAVNACAQLGQQIDVSIGSSISVNGASITLPCNIPNIDVQNIMAGVFANINEAISIGGQASLDIGVPQVSVGGITLPITISCLPHVELPSIEFPSVELPSIELPSLPEICADVMGNINAFVALEAQASVQLPCLNAQALIHSLHTMIASATNTIHELEQISVGTCGSSDDA